MYSTGQYVCTLSHDPQRTDCTVRTHILGTDDNIFAGHYPNCKRTRHVVFGGGATCSHSILRGSPSTHLQTEKRQEHPNLQHPTRVTQNTLGTVIIRWFRTGTTRGKTDPFFFGHTFNQPFFLGTRDVVGDEGSSHLSLPPYTSYSSESRIWASTPAPRGLLSKNRYKNNGGTGVPLSGEKHPGGVPTGYVHTVP